jgi:hypothetical protein
LAKTFGERLAISGPLCAGSFDEFLPRLHYLPARRPTEAWPITRNQQQYKAGYGKTIKYLAHSLASMSSFTLAVFVGLFALALAQQQPPPPPFLQGQSPDVVNSFHQVLQKGHGMTDTQLDQEVEAWVATQGASVKVSYN